MTWVRRQADEPQPHRCEPPMARIPADPLSFDLGSPDGRHGDLWRCDECRQLWRVASACDGCDRSTGHNTCRTGSIWRHARFVQEFMAFWRGR